MNTVCNTVYSKECSEVCSGKIRSEERVEVCGKVHLTQDDKLLLYDGGEIVKNIDDFRVERRTCACIHKHAHTHTRTCTRARELHGAVHHRTKTSPPCSASPTMNI